VQHESELARLRKQAGLSQVQLADRLGAGQSFISGKTARTGRTPATMNQKQELVALARSKFQI
jgi:transcriptional regulator with XRE-family HTH domain